LTSLHLCTSDAWGGLELYAATLMKELQHAGCDVLAICKPDSKIHRFLSDAGIETIVLPSYSVVSIRAIRTIRSILRERHVDVVHVHFHKDIWVASLALRGDTERRLFLSIYMGVPKKNDPWHRFIYKRVDAIFTSSQELNRRLPQLYPVPSSKIHFLPYGRYIDRYVSDERKRNDIRRQFGVQQNDILVGTMVRIDPGKGVMDFARSFSYIDPEERKKIKYLIVGEPTRKGKANPHESPFEEHCVSYLRDIEAFIAAEGFERNIFLAGFQSDLTGYLSAMDVFVFPSRDEMYSLVVLDAMGMGLPVVAARAGGNLDQIEEGKSGLFFDVADSRDAAEKIMNYVRDPELRRRHGEQARVFVERRHDINATITTLLDFYKLPRRSEQRV